LSSLRTTSARLSFFSVSWAAAASFQKSGAPARASSSAFSFSARRTSKVPPERLDLRRERQQLLDPFLVHAWGSLPFRRRGALGEPTPGRGG
jgi:hypothetical protein